MAEYFSSEEIVKSDFLFVSYRHADRDTVYGIVDILLSMGVRLWCDRDLQAGDNWNDRVKAIIEHPNCGGVIFFNSVNAFMSTPIAEERAITKEKQRVCLERGKPFLVLPVNIGKPSTTRLLKQTFEALADDDEEIDYRFPLSCINDIVDLFNSKTLYVYADGNNAEACAESLFASIERTLPAAVDVSKIKLKNLGKSLTRTVGELPAVTMGKYKGVPFDDLPPYLIDGDGVVEHRGASYIVEDGKVYTAIGIDWLCIHCHGDEAYLVSDKILEVRTGGADLIKWLNDVFAACAFTKKERACLIGDVGLVGEKDIASADSKDFLRASPSERIAEKQWWLGAFSMGVMQKVVREDGTIYNNGYNSRVKKCGVRPLIKVNMKELMRISENNN